MKAIRTLMAGLGLVMLLPLTAQAQDERLFNDSWFWGVKGGVMTFWTSRVDHQPAPLVGAEWLITRQRAGLLISAEQAFFEEQSSVYDPSAANQDRTVDMEDVRRLNFTLLAMPTSIAGRRMTSLRPYAGLGFSINVVKEATGQGIIAGTPQADTVAARIEDVRSSTSPHLMLGAQTQLGRLALFGQGSVMWGAKRSLFNGGATYVLEGGVRFNMGSAIDRPE